ncbi:hypothetical protein LXL04_038305 [Taraxacum kok-saghyz]
MLCSTCSAALGSSSLADADQFVSFDFNRFDFNRKPHQKMDLKFGGGGTGAGAGGILEFGGGGGGGDSKKFGGGGGGGGTGEFRGRGRGQLPPSRLPPLPSLYQTLSTARQILPVPKPLFLRCSTGDTSPPLSGGSDFDAKVFRHNLTRSDNYNRKGFGHKKETLELMNQEYTSDIIETLKENNYVYTWGNVTVKLAEAYGFCWGVEHAVRIAYEARKQYPDEKIWITNEIIHNPTVNKRLAEMGFKGFPIKNGEKQFDAIDKGDVVVILPAFGAAVGEMLTLRNKQVRIVDTTCLWVVKVWNSVEKHKKGDYTSIIHGKYAHEETVATASFAGKYVIVKNIDEKFKFAISKHFDPDTDLVKAGVANQTTMLKGETEEIGKPVDTTMMRKYGVENINNHFISFNTICEATQVKSKCLQSADHHCKALQKKRWPKRLHSAAKMVFVFLTSADCRIKLKFK